ncbi:unnamed protein product [Paramecium pentaurelia]|uniref:Uncharacterized protein n=1 Tax=Paramecium pentaurelia TaxID=43138 RepID=A0A8S1YK19_9CILI|nr:unnamed protein product [Paramecium pentaurelia]
MSTIFQASNVQDFSLRNSKVTILSKNKSDSSILVFDSGCLVLENINQLVLKSKVIRIGQNQLIFILPHQKTLVAKIKIPYNKFRMVDWCNSRICALIFQNDLILYDIFLNKINKKIQSDFHQISYFTISRKFDQIFCEFQQNINTSICLVFAVKNQAELQQFDKCIACKLMEEQDQDQILLFQNKSNNLFIILAKFDDGFKIEREIQQNLSNPPQSIRKVGYQKNKKDILLLDSYSNLDIYSIILITKCSQKQNVFLIQFNFMFLFLDENLIMLDIKNQLIFENLPPDLSIRPPYPIQPQPLTKAPQVKKRAMQGILTDQSNIQSIELLIQQYIEGLNGLLKIEPHCSLPQVFWVFQIQLILFGGILGVYKDISYAYLIIFSSIFYS